MTTRSLYSIEQFEERLQKFAHEIPKFRTVRAEIDKDSIEIDFYCAEDGRPKRIRVRVTTKTGKVEKWGDMEWEENDYRGLMLEPKNYVDSPHCTKIVGEDKKALDWINQLMCDVQPKPRFRLKPLLGGRGES